MNMNTVRFALLASTVAVGNLEELAETQKRIPERTRLREGELAVARNVERFGPQKARLERVWRGDDPKKEVDDSHEWLKRNFSAQPSFWLDIADTDHCLIVIDGRLTPFIFERQTNSLWRIEGVDKYLERSSFVHVHWGKAIIPWVGGDCHGNFTWSFTDHLEMSYTTHFDGP